MPEFYIIKNLITLNFGENNKSTIGEKSESVIINSKLYKKTLNLLKHRHPKQLKTPQRS